MKTYIAILIFVLFSGTLISQNVQLLVLDINNNNDVLYLETENISSDFGRRESNSRWHKGVDISYGGNDVGFPILSPVSGIVKKINTDGYIGIGNSEPTKRLEISNGALFITGGTGTDGNTRFVISANSSSTNNFMRFENGTDVRFLVTSTGKLYATEIEVNLTIPLGDFVFDDDYTLRPLSDVEQFIKANKHLPGIPSEQTVKEEGLNLGEMDALLLQKIEELTLYIIEMNKKIEEQEKKINELTNR